MKTRSLMMKKCRNLKNEIKTRWGDSINLLYCSHIINKSRRSYIYIYIWLERGRFMHLAPEPPQNVMVLHANEIKQPSSAIIVCSKNNKQVSRSHIFYWVYVRYIYIHSQSLPQGWLKHGASINHNMGVVPPTFQVVYIFGSIGILLDIGFLE